MLNTDTHPLPALFPTAHRGVSFVPCSEQSCLIPVFLSSWIWWNLSVSLVREDQMAALLLFSRLRMQLCVLVQPLKPQQWERVPVSILLSAAPQLDAWLTNYFYDAEYACGSLEFTGGVFPNLYWRIYNYCEFEVLLSFGILNYNCIVIVLVLFMVLVF